MGDTASREAVIIDPVKGLVDRDAKLIEELDLKLKYSGMCLCVCLFISACILVP